VRELAGHPLLAYSIQVAKDSGLFGEHIYVTSDSQEYLDIAASYGAQALPLEPPHATGLDAHWLKHAWTSLGITINDYFILRPTSPFRTRAILKDAYNKYGACGQKPLKAIRRVKDRPEKLWYANSFDVMTPCVRGSAHLEPSMQTPDIYIQDSSLEIRPIWFKGNEAQYTPYFSLGYGGFSIDYEDDWILAEALIERGLAKLPEIK
jgi:CMP-N-acetylneuraminic acid synthetase